MSQTKITNWMRYGYLGRIAATSQLLQRLSVDPTFPSSIQVKAYSLSRELRDLEDRLRTELNTKLDAKGNPRR